MKEAFKLKDRTVFIDIITDQEANVYPMISAGKAHNEMDISPLQQKDPGVDEGERGTGLMRHIISLLVENEAGALSRISGLVLRARLQHRIADGGHHRRSDPVAHDDHHHRLGSDHRADHQAAQQAGRRGQAAGHYRGQFHRA